MESSSSDHSLDQRTGAYTKRVWEAIEVGQGLEGTTPQLKALKAELTQSKAWQAGELHMLTMHPDESALIIPACEAADKGRYRRGGEATEEAYSPLRCFSEQVQDYLLAAGSAEG